MKFKLLPLLLLPFILVGCGGGSSTPPTPPAPPTPPPQTPKVVAIHDQNGDTTSNIDLYVGVLNSSSANMKNTIKKIKLSGQEVEIKDSENISIEYSGDINNPPTLPNIKDVDFEGFYTASCSKPVNSSDFCYQGIVSFTPKSINENQTSSLYNIASLHTYVPFRMVPADNGIAAVSSPNNPNLTYHMTTVDKLGQLAMSFNTALMPKTAYVQSNDLTNHRGPIHATMNLTASGTNVTATYSCVNPNDDNNCLLSNAKLLKTYGTADQTKLVYTSKAPSGFSPIQTSAAVQLALTRSFLISTNQGAVFMLNSPLTNAYSELGVMNGSQSASLASFDDNKSITDITLAYRNSAELGILDDFTPVAGSKAILGVAGELTGTSFDINLDTPTNKSFGAGAFQARTHYNLNQGNSDFVVSLQNNVLTILDNSLGKNKAQPLSTDGLPSTLTKVKMIATSNGNDQVAILVSGYNTDPTVKAYQAYQALISYTKDGIANNIGTVSKFNRVNVALPATPVIFTYNSFTEADGIQTPQQMLVYKTTNKDKVYLDLLDADVDASKPEITQIDVSKTKNIGNPIAFTCSDAGQDDTPSVPDCYLVNDNNEVYKISGINPVATTITAPQVDLIKFTAAPKTAITQAIIDGNTGSLLTLNSADELQLYNMDNGQYDNPLTVALPKGQQANKLYVY